MVSLLREPFRVQVVPKSSPGKETETIMSELSMNAHSHVQNARPVSRLRVMPTGIFESSTNVYGRTSALAAPACFRSGTNFGDTGKQFMKSFARTSAQCAQLASGSWEIYDNTPGRFIRTIKLSLLKLEAVSTVKFSPENSVPRSRFGS